MGGQNVAISLVLLWLWKYAFFRRCVFNEVLSRFQWKNYVHWWSSTTQNSGNLSAKVIILVFFVFSIDWNFEKTEKRMKCRSPFKVTHNSKTEIFIKFWRLALENQVFQESLWSLYIYIYKAFRRFSGSLPCSHATHWPDPRVLATGSVGPP